MEVNYIADLADWCHILPLACLKFELIKNVKKRPQSGQVAKWLNIL